MIRKDDASGSTRPRPNFNSTHMSLILKYANTGDEFGAENIQRPCLKRKSFLQSESVRRKSVKLLSNSEDKDDDVHSYDYDFTSTEQATTINNDFEAEDPLSLSTYDKFEEQTTITFQNEDADDGGMEIKKDETFKIEILEILNDDFKLDSKDGIVDACSDGTLQNKEETDDKDVEIKNEEIETSEILNNESHNHSSKGITCVAASNKRSCCKGHINDNKDHMEYSCSEPDASHFRCKNGTEVIEKTPVKKKLKVSHEEPENILFVDCNEASQVLDVSSLEENADCINLKVGICDFFMSITVNDVKIYIEKYSSIIYKIIDSKISESTAFNHDLKRFIYQLLNDKIRVKFHDEIVNNKFKDSVNTFVCYKVVLPAIMVELTKNLIASTSNHLKLTEAMAIKLLNDAAEEVKDKGRHSDSFIDEFIDEHADHDRKSISGMSLTKYTSNDLCISKNSILNNSSCQKELKTGVNKDSPIEIFPNTSSYQKPVVTNSCFTSKDDDSDNCTSSINVTENVFKVSTRETLKKIWLNKCIPSKTSKPKIPCYDSDGFLEDNEVHNLLDDMDGNLSSLSLSDSEFDSFDSDSESDVSDTESVSSESEWRSNGMARDNFNFTANDGVKISADIGADDVLQIYECIANAEIMILICEETNKYASKSIAETINSPLGILKRSRLHKWTDVTVEEIRLFEGLLLLMGIVQKPTFDSYFTLKPIMETPIFNRMMKRDRFCLILKFLHFSDDAYSDNKLYKIEKLLNLYRQSFQSAYVPSRKILIDESLLLFKGQLNWKMYIPFKRAKFGIECFMLCEAKTAYVHNFIINTGKGTVTPIKVTDVDSSKHSHPTNIVISLMDDFLDQGYFLGIEKYYSSVFLFDYLVSHKTDVIGTVRKNEKGLPKEVTSAELKKGDSFVRYRNKLMCMKWKDQKDVLIMSSVHDAEMKTIVDRGGFEKVKPKVYIDYKDNMTGFNLMDQFLSVRNCARSYLKKYYRKIYLRFLDISVLNAYVIHKKLGGKLSFLQFKFKLISSLFEAYGKDTDMFCSRGRSSREHAPDRLIGRHFLEATPMSESRRKRRRCVVCAAKKQRKLVSFLCSQCKVSLCPTQCFKDYHTKSNFSA